MSEPTRAVAARGQPAPEQRPNILLIITDQQTHSLLSCAGAVFAEFAAASRGASPGSEAHGGAGGIVHCTSISGIATKHVT